MAYLEYLKFNDELVPLPMSYVMTLTDFEADSGGITEAGTKQRDVVREGVIEIDVTFRVSKIWLMKFRSFKKIPKLKVTYLNTESMTMTDTEMFIDGFESKLIKDTSYGSLWEVSFKLQEF